MSTFLDRVTCMPGGQRPGLNAFAATVRKPDHIDAIELAAVVDTGDGSIERVEADEPHDFFSLYWHYAETHPDLRGVECFADLPTLDEARELAALIARRFSLPTKEYI